MNPAMGHDCGVVGKVKQELLANDEEDGYCCPTPAKVKSTQRQG